MARPTDKERCSPQAQKEKLRELCADALAQMKKKIKEADFQTLANFVAKTLPLVINEDTQTESDVQMELLVKKAVKVQLRINEANEQYLKEEDLQDENDEE